VAEQGDVEVKGKSERITCYIVTAFYDEGRKTAHLRQIYAAGVTRGRADATPPPIP